VHDLDCHLGERSPLAALYRDAAWILLLGVGYEACTALHLAEYRLPWPPPIQRYRCYVEVNGERRRYEFDGARHDTTDFARLGAELDSAPFVRTGICGNGPARALPLRASIDFAVVWMSDHRR
jgi:aminoglycoside 3-N-acetyltransferase